MAKAKDIHPDSLITHPDGRVVINRSLAGFGMFLHIELQPWEIERIRKLDLSGPRFTFVSNSDGDETKLEEASLPTHAHVSLFRPSGKWYTDEEWRIPKEVPGGREVQGPEDMVYSPDFRRIDHGSVLVVEQKPWGYPCLLPFNLPPIRRTT